MEIAPGHLTPCSMVRWEMSERVNKVTEQLASHAHLTSSDISPLSLLAVELATSAVQMV